MENSNIKRIFFSSPKLPLPISHSYRINLSLHSLIAIIHQTLCPFKKFSFSFHPDHYNIHQLKVTHPFQNYFKSTATVQNNLEDGRVRDPEVPVCQLPIPFSNLQSHPRNRNSCSVNINKKTKLNYYYIQNLLWYITHKLYNIRYIVNQPHKELLTFRLLQFDSEGIILYPLPTLIEILNP